MRTPWRMIAPLALAGAAACGSAEEPASPRDDGGAGDLPIDVVTAAEDVAAEAAVADASSMDAAAQPDVVAPVDAPTDVPWLPPTELLVRAGSAWRYLDTNADPRPAWTSPGFDDRAWRSGRAELGYGEGDEATTVSYGPDANNKYITTYFRQTFTVRDPTTFRSVMLRLVRDDGAVVYLNGREVYRDNMPMGAVAHATRAPTTVGGADESRFFESMLPTSALVAGSNTLAVEVHQSDPSSSDLSFDLELVASRGLMFPSTDGDPVFVGAGDIAHCHGDADERTARLVDEIPGTVFLLGDNVYGSGTDDEFMRCFHPTWGRHRARTRPSVGNHEYLTRAAAGYYRYFGAAAGEATRGYYSYDLGTWHVVVINSNCSDIGGCGAGSPQDRWLVSDLAAHPTRCTVAYWHHPRWSSGPHGNQTFMDNVYRRLYDAGADVVLVGHDHHYERFAPLDPTGRVDMARGVREFVVGTGGIEFRPLSRAITGSEARNDTDHGVLRLVLHPAGYDWRFIPVAGRTFTDAGSAECH